MNGSSSLLSVLCRRAMCGLAVLALLAHLHCRPDHEAESADHRVATRICLAWNQLLLDLERHTPGYRAPISARNFAYIEMAAYEAALPGMDGYVSLKNICPGYVPIPLPGQEQYCLPLALNAAYARILQHFFANAPDCWKHRISSLEQEYSKEWAEAQDVPSVLYGKSVAEAVWAFSQTDTVGSRGLAHLFDDRFVPRQEAGAWHPAPWHPTQTMLPHWGQARPLGVHTRDITVRAPVPFGKKPGSPFHTQAMEVFTTAHARDKEAEWIAEFWGDDLPGLTVTPAGRWISITHQALTQAHPSFALTMETWLKTAWALCNAGIISWEAKYHYQVQRPSQYIGQHIQPHWSPLHDNPPFPSYPSGHATFGAAAAEVLTAQLGESILLRDRTHEGRAEFASTPRTFHSFGAMAQENAFSRLLMGVHYRMDCEEGLRLGKIIGKKMNELPLRWSEAALSQ